MNGLIWLNMFTNGFFTGFYTADNIQYIFPLNSLFP